MVKEQTKSNRPKRIWATSDTHLFSQARFDHEGMAECIDAAAVWADIVLLNGDIIEIRYPEHTIDDSITRGIKWLEKLLDEHPSTEFIYVPGNHDENVNLDLALSRLAETRPNFTLTSYAKLENDRLLFLHGDVLFGDKNPQRRLLTTNEDDAHLNRRYGKFLGTFGAGLVKMVDNVLLRPQIFVPWLLNRIEKYDHTLLDGVEHIFTGHTHIPFSDYCHKTRDGRVIYFHNTGTLANPEKANPIGVEVSEENVVLVERYFDALGRKINGVLIDSIDPPSRDWQTKLGLKPVSDERSMGL